MEKTGITRKIDELGRIVIPVDLRRRLEMGEKEVLELFLDNDKIVLRKYEPWCVLCGGTKVVTVINGKNICADCIKHIKEVSL